MSGVYEGLTVVELADRRNQWAGKLLSDGGARVIQIEPIQGSPGRWCGPFVEDKVDPDRCLDYWWNNTGKQSVALDLARKPAQDLLRKLLARADVFLESTAPGTLAKLRPGLRLRRGQQGADLRLAHRLRPGRAVARFSDERRRASRARRRRCRARATPIRPSRRSAARAIRPGTWAARSCCTASPSRCSTA